MWIYFLSLSAAFFTSIYSARLLFYVFYAKPNMSRVIAENIHEPSWEMTIPLSVLCIFSMFIGFIFSDGAVGWGTFFWGNSLFILPENFYQIDSEFVSPFIKNLPFLVSFLGSFSCLLFYFSFEKYIFPRRHLKIYRLFLWYINFVSPFFYYAGFFNAIYNDFFFKIFKISYVVNTKILDKGFLELMGPYGLYRVFFYFSLLSKVLPPLYLFISLGFFFFFNFSC